jgi:hypothetical protein
MRRRILILTLAAGVVAMAVWLLSRPVPGYTRMELADPDAGRDLASFVLRDDEPVALTWRNSLWGLDVTEGFVARGGLLIQNEVTFAQPDGSPPPQVRPEDVDDLYHTGGAFSAKGLVIPLPQVVYRVGEIGNPKMRVRDRIIEFKPLVGFGGRVVLTTSISLLYEVIAATL